MDIRGRIAFVGDIATGKSQRTGNDWKSQDVVVEYYEHDTDRYPDRVLVRIMNERIDELQLHENDLVTATVGFDVREYNGRHYLEARCYKMTKEQSAPQATTAPEIQPVVEALAETAAKQEASDLPF
jgi:hypothetical protein